MTETVYVSKHRGAGDEGPLTTWRLVERSKSGTGAYRDEAVLFSADIGYIVVRGKEFEDHYVEQRQVWEVDKTYRHKQLSTSMHYTVHRVDDTGAAVVSWRNDVGIVNAGVVKPEARASYVEVGE